MNTTERQASENIEIYPNPATESVNFTLYNMEEAITQIEIIDASGKRVFNFEINGPFYQLKVDGLESGMYIANIVNGSKKYVEKLVVH
ncbi:MAG: T9SS type A sorting domain-containing protein [Crocinitomicaceae bacterium]